MKKLILFSVIALSLMSNIVKASVQEDFNSAEHFNQEWQATEMQKQINEIKQDREWDSINAANVSSQSE